MIYESQIDWSLFTQQEMLNIQKLLENGHTGDLAAVVNLNLPVEAKGLVFAKVAELEKIKLLAHPQTVDKESEVNEEYQKFQAKGGVIKTPEQEKKWQEKFEKENQTLKQEVKGKVEAVVSSSVKTSTSTGVLPPQEQAVPSTASKPKIGRPRKTVVVAAENNTQ